LTVSVRVANARLKVVLFSLSCGASVRVAGKGLAGEHFCDAALRKEVEEVEEVEEAEDAQERPERTGNSGLDIGVL
jgi:hypothetical protein